MKKLVIGVVVLVALLAVAPWGVGRVAEKRLDRGLEQLVEAAPYLSVVERKYTPGWFKSEQVVTFEAFGPWMKAVTPKALEAAMSVPAPEAAGEVASATDAEPAAAPEAPADAGGNSAGIADPQKLMRFTVRNEVLHGPVLGLAGFGIARVNSHLVLDEKTRKGLEEIFGSKAPVEVTTRIGFLGGGTTTFKSEGRTIKPKDSTSEVTWESFELAIGFSRNLDDYDVDGKWPKLELTNHDSNSHFVLTNMSIDGHGKRVRGDLYDGNLSFTVGKVSFAGADKDNVEINEALYVANSETKGDFTGMGVKLGLGEVKSRALAAQGFEIKEAHYDISVRRLHTETLEKVIAALKAAYGKPPAGSQDVADVMFAPVKQHGMELLKYDPEFSIERIGFATPDGDGYIKGVVKLKGVTAEDLGFGSMALLGKLNVDITIDASEKMVLKFPNGSAAADGAVESGYVKREGERLICKIVLANGELTVNGKPQAIPGLGGPPPGADAVAPPPQ